MEANSLRCSSVTDFFWSALIKRYKRRWGILTLDVVWIEAHLHHGGFAEGEGEPGCRAHKASELGTFYLLKIGNDLDGAGAIADDANSFVAQIVAMK